MTLGSATGSRPCGVAGDPPGVTLDGAVSETPDPLPGAAFPPRAAFEALGESVDAGRDQLCSAGSELGEAGLLP